MSIEGLTIRAQNNGDVGFVMGVERLGIPPIQMQDAAYGVRMSARNGRVSAAGTISGSNRTMARAARDLFMAAVCEKAPVT